MKIDYCSALVRAASRVLRARVQKRLAGGDLVTSSMTGASPRGIRRPRAQASLALLILLMLALCPSIASAACPTSLTFTALGESQDLAVDMTCDPAGEGVWNASGLAIGPQSFSSTLPGGAILAFNYDANASSSGTTTIYHVQLASLPLGAIRSSSLTLYYDPNAQGVYNSTLLLNVALPVPTITAVSPASGPVTGNTTVTLTGAGFTKVQSVRVGGTVASTFSVLSDSTMTLLTPAGSVGTVDISLANPWISSATSASDQYTYQAVAPGAPTSVAATAGNTTATVSFAVPSSNGGSAITGYTVTASPGGMTVSGSGSPLTVTGLVNGTTYTFSVTATNGVGTSTASAPSGSVTPQGPQTINFSNPGAQTFGTSPTLTASATSGLTVTFSSGSASVCTVTAGGQLSFVSAGSCSISADQAGGGAYTAAPTVTQVFNVNALVPGAPTGVSATASDGQATVTFAAPASNGGDAITQYVAIANPGGASGSCAGPGACPITIAGLSNGTSYTFTVTATNSVGTGGASSPSTPVTPKAAQSITFNPPGAQNFGTTPTLTATASSGLSVSFSSSTTAVCTITSGGALTFLTAGTCTIQADQAGDGSYLAATTRTQSFTVNAVVPGAPAIGAATAGDQQATVSFAAPASNGGSTITQYTVTSNPGGLTATSSVGPLTVTGLTNGVAYTFTVTATNTAGTGAASAASGSVTPAGTQTITFANPGAQNFGTTPTLTATATSGLPVTFTSSTTGVCTITSGGTMTLVSVGTCTINANQLGDTSHLPATPVSQSFTVSAVVPGAPTIGSAVPGNGQATVSFTPPAFTGGQSITGYTVTSNPGGITGTTSASPAVVTGLTNGVAYTFTVTATNSAGTGAASAASGAVTPQAMAITTLSLPNGQVGITYQQTITATGGSGSHTFAVSSGSLPAGLTLSSGGSLSGTATAAGSFTFTVQVTDGAGQTATQSYTLQVGSPTLTLTPATLPGGTGETPYSATFATAGGIAPYHYAVTSGSLPAGMVLNASTGSLSGTPTVAGTANFTVTATDSSTGTGAPFTVSQPYAIAVSAPSITLTPATLPSLKVGAAVQQTLQANGGVAPYAYAVTSGALPAGTTLATGGQLSGTPSAAGSYTFTVTATDNHGFTGVQSFTVLVGQPAPVATNDSGSTAANSPLTLAVTGNDTGPITSIAVAQAPAHGTAVVNGLQVIYTPSQDYFGSDSFTYVATGPGGNSAPATVSVSVTPLAVPTVVAQTVTTLAGKAVTIHAVQGAAGGPFTVASVITPPSAGSVSVSGTDLIYTSAADASGSVTFDYALANAFGTSPPARVTVTVNPQPIPVALSASVLAGSTVNLDLTSTAHGGPFTGANVVSVTPANAGTATIHAQGSGFSLQFVAAANFGGVAQLSYTLSNAFATSAPGTLSLTVTARPDPSKDAEVLGIAQAQVDAARRLAQGQVNNFQRRLESLHAGADAGGFSNGITLSSASQQNRDPMQRLRGDGDGWSRRYLVQPEDPSSTSAASASAGSPAGGTLPGGIAVWTGGALNFGKSQPGSSDNGIDFTTSGLSMGADKRINDALAMGVGLGYGHDASDVGNHGSRSAVDSYNVAFYASYRPYASLYADTLIGYQWLSFDARRYVTSDGSSAHGTRDGSQWFGSFALGYEHRTKDLLLSPYARLDIAHGQLDGYTESGVLGDTLSYQRQTLRTTTGNLGLRLEWTSKQEYGTWMPSLRAEYQHDFQGASGAVMRYADLLAGPLYQASVNDLSRNHTMLGAGVRLQTLRGWLFRFEYQSLIDNNTRDNQSLLLGVERKFDP